MLGIVTKARGEIMPLADSLDFSIFDHAEPRIYQKK